MLLATYREVEAGLRPDASDVLTRIARAATVLHLPRFRQAEVATYVRDAIDAADERMVAMVYQTTQGNPLFVAEVVRQIAAEGDLVTIPLGVREIIRQRLGLAGPATRNVLEAGAVLGVQFGAAELARMTAGAAEALDAAARIGLLGVRGDVVRFTHALYREALYHDLPPGRRQELHRAAARSLGATGAPIDEIAHHLLESGPDAAPDAIDHAIRAARHALDQFAFEDAAALLERARLAVPGGAIEAALRCRVTIALGEVRLRSGDPAGRELCVEGAALARELGDATLLASAGLAYGSIFSIGGVDPVMVDMLEEALAGLPETDSGLRARTMARLASARQPSPPAERARDIALAFAAIEMGRRTADRRDMLEILQSASGALYGAADPRRRLPIAGQMEELAEQLGDTPRLLAARVRLAMDHLELADMASYAHVADAYQRLAGPIGRAAAPWRVPLMRSMLALAKEDFAGSERWQEESRRIDDESPRARRAQALHRICFLRAAERHIELRASVAELRGVWMQLPYGHALADARVASTLARVGADDEVRAILAALPEDVFEEQINAVPLAEAVWATGDRRQAELLAPVLAEYGDRWAAYWLDVEFADAPASRGLAYLAGLTGEWDRSEHLFAGALRAVEDAGRRSMAARMRFELGDLLIRCGREPERARALLADARSAAAGRGLDQLIALIDRRHPGLAPAPTAAPPAGRTVFAMEREGEVYAITSARGTLRFKATRGMIYLARLVERPGGGRPRPGSRRRGRRRPGRRGRAPRFRRLRGLPGATRASPRGGRTSRGAGRRRAGRARPRRDGGDCPRAPAGLGARRSRPARRIRGRSRAQRRPAAHQGRPRPDRRAGRRAGRVAPARRTHGKSL